MPKCNACLNIKENKDFFTRGLCKWCCEYAGFVSNRRDFNDPEVKSKVENLDSIVVSLWIDRIREAMDDYRKAESRTEMRYRDITH